MPRRTPLERFIAKTRITESGCWEWTASKVHDGYGWFSEGGHNVRAHRWAYEQFRGPIAPNMTIDHLCKNRGCVNPAHLEAVSIRENLLRGDTFQAANSQKTHCPQGHPYDKANTRYKKRRDGLVRICKVCEAVGAHRRQVAKPKRGRPTGERSGAAKLTWVIVDDIRARHAGGELCIRLAEEFGVASPTIQRIVKNVGWKEETRPKGDSHDTYLTS